MAYNSVITNIEMNKLLKYLEFFQNPNSIFYNEIDGYKCETQEVMSFRDLMVFDWSQWINDNKVYKDVGNRIDDNLMNVDLETLRKLMTSYIRGDRFSEGLFIDVILNGTIAKILLRLKELKD
ncbi:hypothetical protein BVG16_22460 [Paenibacillus selenitireducens]|uniref:Uncharacterized protein n=1 Tax=Paenibacillus selenitireducens TaxID=1324314 RepID=A0A1T2X6C0_9BACL|nr:DUF6508 domain-containing protein [Paenibacillus selenitireducens]OPA75355.1 hypothetical protein BVG16_22460 [Paenibacillus selenitireducens]